MTVNTGGKVRGWIGRWLMRFEAASSILRIIFLGVTAVSTLSTYLAVANLDRYTPYVMVIGFLGTVVFAYVYAELGVFNRKNRERADYGDNYSGPTMLMDKWIEAEQLALLAYLLDDEGRDYEEIRGEMEEVTLGRWSGFRDGVNPEELEA